MVSESRTSIARTYTKLGSDLIGDEGGEGGTFNRQGHGEIQ